MDTCKIVEDLLPLYEEGLVQEETRQWMEQHFAICSDCASLIGIDLPKVEPVKPELSAEKMIAKTKLKLTIYQLLFVALSFVFAMSTAIFTEQGFGFVLSYFVLGAVVYGFYHSWLLLLVLSFVPVFIWNAFYTILTYDSISVWWNEMLQYDSPMGILFQLIFAGLFTAVIHTAFAVLGAMFIALIKKAFQKEEAV